MDTQQASILFPPAPTTEYALLAASGIRWLLCKIGLLSPVDSFPVPPVLLLLFLMRSFAYFAGFASPQQKKPAVYWAFGITCFVVWLADLLRMRCSIPWLIAGGAYFMNESISRNVMLLLGSLDLMGLRILTVAQTVSLTYAVFVFSLLYMAVVFVFGVALALAVTNPEFLEGFKAGMQQSYQQVTNNA